MKHIKQINPIKSIARWGLAAFVKLQIGGLLGGGLALILPGLAVSIALLIASSFLYEALTVPGHESIAPMLLGLAIGVLANV